MIPVASAIGREAVRGVAREDWQEVCARLSHSYAGSLAKIEVISKTFGREVAVAREHMLGINLDSTNDVVELMFGDMDHYIHSPREIYLDDLEFGGVSLEIVDGAGVRQVVTLDSAITFG